MRSVHAPTCLCLALATAACGARSGLRCPAPAAADVALLDASVEDAPRDVPIDTGVCAVPLHVESTEVPFGCVIDLRVGHDATLVYPCAGGAASLPFADGAFTGSVRGGRVELRLDTMFNPGIDGCDWVSHQTITGDLNAGTLAYEYTEEPAPGATGCLPPCPVSRAVIAVHPGTPVDAGGADAHRSTACER